MSAEWQREQPIEITDAMCWRGQKAWSDYMEHDEMQVVWRGAMRAALEAALNGGTE